MLRIISLHANANQNHNETNVALYVNYTSIKEKHNEIPLHAQEDDYNLKDK